MKPAANFLFLLCFAFSQAQPETAQMYKYGGSLGEYFRSFIQTQDGGFLLGGWSNSPVSGQKTNGMIGNNWDYWIVKTDASGQPEWDRTFGGGDSFIFTELRGEILNVVRQTSNGNYFIGGYSDSPVYGTKTEPSYGAFDFWILKLDENGDIIWQKDIGGAEDEDLRTLEPTPDGGCIAGGLSKSGISGNKIEANRGMEDYWVVKLAEDGQLEWQKTLGGDSIDVLSSVLVQTDGYLLAGYSASGISGDKTSESYGGADYWLVKLDLNGNEMWQKNIGGNSGDILYRAVLADDGFVLGGESYSNISNDKSEPSRGSADYWLVKTDFDGNVLFDKTYGGSDYDGLYDLKICNGGYIMSGTSSSDASGEKSEDNFSDQDGWVVRADADGNFLWDKTFGGPLIDGFNQVAVFPNNSFIYGGGSFSHAGTGNVTVEGAGGSDYWLVKTQPENLSAPQIQQNAFAVFPNPTAGNVNVHFSKPVNEVSVEVFNALSQRLSTEQFESAENVEVSMPDSGGIYFVKIKSDGKTETVKIVKR